MFDNDDKATLFNEMQRYICAQYGFFEEGGTYHLMVPEGYKHVDITKVVNDAAATPMRKKGTIILFDISSFMQYLQTHGKKNSSCIYVDPASRAVVAVLNDHVMRDADDASAGWRDFRALYTAELHPDLKTWVEKDRVKQTQDEFSAFLEDNISDLLANDGALLMKTANTLQMKADVEFKSHKRLDNGQSQLTFNETINARAGEDGSIEIPRDFTIRVKIFKNGGVGDIKARLKYRLSSGKINFWYELERVEDVIETAFNQQIEVLKTGIFPVLVGKNNV